MQSGNSEADEIFDTEKGLNGTPSTKLLEGRESKFTAGVTVKNPDDLVLEVTPDFDHASVMYVS